MAGANTNVYKFNSIVRGQHIDKSAWTPFTDKTCNCILWEDNKICCKRSTVAASKEDAHIKRDTEDKLTMPTL